MNPLEQVNGYLRTLESRLRWTALSRGFAAIAIAALAATVVLVVAINSYAFSEPSLRVARVLLFLCVAIAIAVGLAIPLTRLNRRRAARLAEARVPDFNQRLLTFAEGQPEKDPFLELLAADAMDVARTAQPEHVVNGKWIFGSLSAGTVAAVVLLWAILMAPGWFGHGAALLWAGTPRVGTSTAFYEIIVEPGTKSVRKRSDAAITAQLVGFTSAKAQLFAKFASSSQWEPAPMEPHEAGFRFIFAAIPETVEYYVESNGIRSKHFKLNAIDLPGIKKLRVSYEFPKWSGLKNAVEDPGGDLRAIEGTTATVSIETDQKLTQGVLKLEDGTRIDLERGEGNWLSARVPVSKDGMYHIAAVEKGEDIRLSEDYFIEAQKEEPPKVRIARPGSDARVSPIEEVTVVVEADDDFGLNSLELHYSVNGGAEKVIPLQARGQKTAEGQTLISLEEFKMVPGDVIALYAKAKDARNETSSDMLFLEAQPFEREYTQSQMSGGGGGGGGEQEQDDQVSKRQKEIIAATFNQIRDKKQDKAAQQENAKFLSEQQAKLQAQTQSLANRVRSRELAGSNAEFQSFTKDMEAAAQAMGEASGKLKTQGWKEAIPSEQKALQHLLRAEATRRQIQVAFGRQGGGGGGGGAGRDLESLFDLELDMEKNQYETGAQSASSDQRAKEIDDALQKLEQLARRQQELAEKQKQGKDAPQQRWQQEMLRREAEELRRKMEQMARSGQQQRGQQQGQQGQQSASSQGQQGQQGQQSGQSGQSGSSGGSQQDQRLRQAVDRLTRATDDMRRAASNSQPGQQGQSSADARRAADRLSEAKDALGNMRQQESGQSLDGIANRAQRLAQQQQQFVDKLKQQYGNGRDAQDPRQALQGQGREAAEALAREKEQMMNDLTGLEKDMQNAVRSMAGSQRQASSKLREALGSSQQNETKVRMKYQAQAIRQGYGSYVAPREQPITEGLNRLAEQVGQARAALGPGSQQGNDPKQPVS